MKLFRRIESSVWAGYWERLILLTDSRKRRRNTIIPNQTRVPGRVVLIYSLRGLCSMHQRITKAQRRISRLWKTVPTRSDRLRITSWAGHIFNAATKSRLWNHSGRHLWGNGMKTLPGMPFSTAPNFPLTSMPMQGSSNTI